MDPTDSGSHFGHLSDTLANDNKNLLMTPEVVHDMMRVRVKVEITSMSRYDRKDQSLGCFEKFLLQYFLIPEHEPKTVVMYEPFLKSKPMQFIDTHIMAGKILEKGAGSVDVYFLSFVGKTEEMRLNKCSLVATPYQAGQSVNLTPVEDADEVEKIVPDVVFPPTWIVNKAQVRLGGGKYRWTNYIRKIKKINDKLKVFGLIFDVQSMEEDLPDQEKMLKLDDVFCANEIYYPPTEDNKHDEDRSAWSGAFGGGIPGMMGPRGMGSMPGMGAAMAGRGGMQEMDEMERMLEGMGAAPPNLRQCPTNAPNFPSNSNS